MAKPVAIKPEEEYARSYADRLILEKLIEMESVVKLGELADKLQPVGIGLAAVRALLASNGDRFAYHERRWIPAARLEGEGRPLAEALDLVLDRYGAPMDLALVVTELARIRKSTLASMENAVRRLAEKDAAFLITEDERVALTRWSFVVVDEKLDRALALNQIDPAELEAVREKLKDINLRLNGSILKALEATAPISLKVLGAAVYSVVTDPDPRSVLIFDAREFAGVVFSAPGFVYGSDGFIHREDETKKWVLAASRLADKLAPSIELEDAAPIEVKPEDVEKLVAKVLSNEGSTTAIKLLEENYEITPGTKTFPDDLANLMAALRSQVRLQWVGGDRFRKAGEVPDTIHEVPEPFQFVETDLTDEEGNLIDVELTDDGLSQTLRRLLQHPLATDVLDEDLQPAGKQLPESVRLVLKSIHRELGTFPLSQFPTGWLDTDPKIQEMILIDPAGRELQAWVNTDARLIYNLFDWWYEQPVENGAVFTVTKTNKPNVFEFDWLDQPDPVVYISSQRMEELRTIATEAEGKSTLDLLIQVMSHWPKGADYLTLLAEVNVVRRSSRRLVASLLSSYQCFYQRSGSPVWQFDPKKVEQGFDKTKRKFVKK